jgi:hypothetical protein
MPILKYQRIFWNNLKSMDLKIMQSMERMKK